MLSETTRHPVESSKSLHPLPLILWPLVFISQLLVASLIAWHLLAQFNFGYSLAYESLAIDEHITRFGPKNRYRPDFETTDKNQHLVLFAQIGDAIQDHGNGLAEITYQTDTGQTHTLLRNAEVIHLQDVANLVDVFYLSGMVSLGILLLGILIAWQKKLPLPGSKAIAIGVVAVVAAVALVLALVGFKDAFYWLHVQIFPEDHEWFFYYQDSLMTTLMKAPDLFGFIGALLGGLILLFWIAEIIGLRLLLQSGRKT